MANLKTKVTELATGLGMLGFADIEAALSSRPRQMVSVSPELWLQLEEAHSGGLLAEDFNVAFDNGQAFLHARDGLRGRIPEIIEWKGAQSNPGDAALPVDLRIDHVYLISCKYVSQILHNASPVRVFDQCLRSTAGVRSTDWYFEAAPNEYLDFYRRTVEVCGLEGLPVSPVDLSTTTRALLRSAFPKQWPDEVEDAYAKLSFRVSEESAARWSKATATPSDQEATLWRLLRFGPAPYFILGHDRRAAIRLRIATPWDWRQRYQLREFAVSYRYAGQPMVGWRAVVRDRHSGKVNEVAGHVEIRWSHGRFGGAPEAKVYLDTPHVAVPGYFALA